MIIPQKDLQGAVYPTLRVIIFIFCTLLMCLFITPFLGIASSYHALLEDGVAVFVFFRFLILITITLFSFALLFFLGRICKRKTTKLTYLIMFIILLTIGIWATLSFLDGNLWNYRKPEKIIFK
ncbi:hypothetical protein LY11_01789 [Pedobacter cryoconitis]|uniref:Uncharacterized protein n=1 Tax=Pedobacter cryoconitis TaxID=188932 RepID=A0A327SVY8_9SPHI|nr:hypothetical protein LY11_01789 [Pedobacter cryoconitis]